MTCTGFEPQDILYVVCCLHTGYSPRSAVQQMIPFRARSVTALQREVSRQRLSADTAKMLSVYVTGPLRVVTGGKELHRSSCL